MAKQDEYRNYARDAVRLASHASSTAKKSLLLALAERWLDLADAQNKRASRPAGVSLVLGIRYNDNQRAAVAHPFLRLQIATTAPVQNEVRALGRE